MRRGNMGNGDGARVARGGWVQMAVGAAWARAWADGLAAELAAGLQGCCNIELGYAMPQCLNRLLAPHAHAYACCGGGMEHCQVGSC